VEAPKYFDPIHHAGRHQESDQFGDAVTPSTRGTTPRAVPVAPPSRHARVTTLPKTADAGASFTPILKMEHPHDLIKQPGLRSPEESSRGSGGDLDHHRVARRFS
jgi:hypothetical protein